ncbi:MAG: UDP binding domain-containing protein, partial [bacterium]
VEELVVYGLNRRRRCLNGAKILVLGVAYKRGVGDTRESPALEILARLREKGAEVSYADPYVPSVVLNGATLKAVEFTDRDLEAADCVLILTDHPEFDYQRLVAIAPLVIDTRSATRGIPVPEGRVITL